MAVLSPSSWTGNGESEYVPMAETEDSRPTFLPPVLLLALGIPIGINMPLYLSIYSRRLLSSISLLPRALPPVADPLTVKNLVLLGLPPPEDPIQI
nr:hypothetical protein L203_05409 [Cryptococcus depauperatus CBS 7841]